MRSEEEIKERLERIKEYINTVPKKNLLTETERIAFAGSSGAIEVLEWVLQEKTNEK